jgi:hypothetical protein
MDDGSQFRETLKQAMRRAGLHWIRAGYEVVAGWGALLDEVVRARRADEAESEVDEESGPTRIELE